MLVTTIVVITPETVTSSGPFHPLSFTAELGFEAELALRFWISLGSRLPSAVLPLLALWTFQNCEEREEDRWWLKRLRERKSSQAFFLAEDLNCLYVLSLCRLKIKIILILIRNGNKRIRGI